MSLTQFSRQIFPCASGPRPVLCRRQHFLPGPDLYRAVDIPQRGLSCPVRSVVWAIYVVHSVLVDPLILANYWFLGEKSRFPGCSLMSNLVPGFARQASKRFCLNNTLPVEYYRAEGMSGERFPLG